jgi:hypothetical protein
MEEGLVIVIHFLFHEVHEILHFLGKPYYFYYIITIQFLDNFNVKNYILILNYQMSEADGRLNHSAIDPEPETFRIACIIGASFSIVCSIILVFSFTKNKSIQARLLKYVSLGEAIYMYSQLVIILNNDFEQAENTFCRIVEIIAFNYVGDNHTLSCGIINTFNKCLFYSMQAFSFLINTFICFETIWGIRYPISKVAKRFTWYKFSAVILAGSYITIMFSTAYDDSGIIKEKVEERIFHSKVLTGVNFTLFVIYLIFAVANCSFLFWRFCKAKGIANNLKNRFVIRHFIYFIIYLGFIFPFQLNALLYISDQKLTFLRNSIIISFYMGIGMFLARATETKFYGKIKAFYIKMKKSPSFILNSRKSMAESEVGPRESDAEQQFFDPSAPLTHSIQRTINLEFMCCILYGLTEIFMKQERKYKKSMIMPNNNNNLRTLRDHSKSIEIDIQAELIEDNQNLRNNPKFDSIINNKDFTKKKSHSVYYSKLYDSEENDEINIDKMGVKISSKRTIEDTPVGSLEDNLLHQERLVSENSTSSIFSKDKKQDAHITEYCPRIFKELRSCDEIDPFNLEK